MTNLLSKKNCWLNIYKPHGYSSAKVVAIVKRITKAKKAGHGGTLDPLASGVLPIAINKATKISDYILNDDKEYVFEITWGQFRSTDDEEGEIIEESSKRPAKNDIINILPDLIGDIKQIPSKYSAIKINGKKAYELARKKIDFNINPRNIKIYQIYLISSDDVKCRIKVTCSKGTYVRSLCRDICLKLGVCGYVSKLERIKTGIFQKKSAISLDKLKNMLILKNNDGFICEMSDILHFMTEVSLNDDLAIRLKNGQSIFLDKILPNPNDDNTFKITHNNELIGIGKIDANKLKPIKIFNNL